MKAPLGTEVDLAPGPGHFLLDGFPAIRERGTAAPPRLFSAHVYCGHGRPSQLLLSCCYLKGKGLDSWYSAAYTELTHDQHRFTVTDVATDRQEPILTGCAWQNYATVSKLTRDINQEKSSSIPSTNAENKQCTSPHLH